MLYLYFIFWTLGGQLLGSLPFIFYIFSVHLCQDFLCLPFMGFTQLLAHINIYVCPIFCLCFYVCVLLNVNISGGENLHTVNILVENDTLAVLDSTVDGISRKDR